MNRHKTKMLVSILMESSLYLTLPLEERRSLLIRLLKDYPFLFDAQDRYDKDGVTEFGYESS